VQVNSIAVTLAQPTVVNVDAKGGSDTLTANAPVTLLYDPAAFDGGLTINANSTVSFAASTGLGGVTPRAISGVNIAGGASVKLAPHVGNSDATVLVLSQMNIAPTGRLDLGYGALIVKQGNLAAVTGKLATGMSTAGLGAWNGYGIMSSTAAGDTSHIRAVGVMRNDNGFGGPIYGTTTPYGLFEGQNPAANDVLVRVTYYGDADLNGQVDGGDYSKTDNGFNTKMGTTAGWTNGDYNYDGAVDGGDYALIDNAFALQSTQSAGRSPGYLPPPMTTTGTIASAVNAIETHPSAQHPQPALDETIGLTASSTRTVLVRDLVAAPDDVWGARDVHPGLRWRGPRL
jgi:hypothetical protein